MAVSKIYMDTLFGLHVLMLPFIIYVILKNSKSMPTYSYYLLNEIFWNSLLMCLFAAISPIYSGVYFMFLVNSSLESLFDIHIWYNIIEFNAYVFLNMIFAMCASIYYRAFHFLDLTGYVKLVNLIDRPLFLVITMTIFQVFDILVVVAIELGRNNVLSQQNYDNLVKDDPVLEEWLINRKVIGNL
jgi:hypothetical protein